MLGEYLPLNPDVHVSASMLIPAYHQSEFGGPFVIRSASRHGLRAVLEPETTASNHLTQTMMPCMYGVTICGVRSCQCTCVSTHDLRLHVSSLHSRAEVCCRVMQQHAGFDHWHHVSDRSGRKPCLSQQQVDAALPAMLACFESLANNVAPDVATQMVLGIAGMLGPKSWSNASFAAIIDKVCILWHH